VDVIIPLRNMASELGECLSPIIEQLDHDDRVVVVDDASTDDTARTAEMLGAHVLPIADSRGPYYARHTAAMQSTAEQLLFIDGRSRPMPGLLEAHKALLSRPDIALSCTETRTRTGPTLAERISAKRQPFALKGYVGVSARLDFFPTCNLGVRTDSYRHVGGFRQMRSGGDADLCWRIQKAGLGGMAADPRVLMEWAPRSSLTGTLEQWYRYGKSTRYLEWVWPDQSPKASGRDFDWRRVLKPRGAETAASLAYAAGLWRGGREDKAAPVHYDWSLS
jgi:glycosyltransferase involved in cell wall biosynthesis